MGCTKRPRWPHEAQTVFETPCLHTTMENNQKINNVFLISAT